MISLQSILRKSISKTILNSGRLNINTLCKGGHSTSPFLIRNYSTSNNNPLNQPKSKKELSESFLDGTSAVYVEDMYQSWKKDPTSVHQSWSSFFNSSDNGARVGEAYMSPPTLGTSQATKAEPSTSSDTRQNVSDSMKLLLLIRAYQVRGHIVATLDPLNLANKQEPPELNPSKYGFTDADMDRQIYVGDSLISGFLTNNAPVTTLRQVLTRLKQTYCGNIGVEYMHIQDREMCDWIREKFETPEAHQISKEEKIKILERLSWAEQFEGFLQLKYKTKKRFGVDGCESLIPGMKGLIDHAADCGVNSIVMGMPHRGRLNVLANVVRKPLPAIFNEFNGGVISMEGEYSGTGDVKYHLGTSYDRVTSTGKKVHLSLVANPSHLEAVNPVVEGKVRAKQHYSNDANQDKTLAITLHGDASVAGQGIVYETLHLMKLQNYSTGGTIHIVVNNQIGFTTNPSSSRSSEYCTDVAKTVDSPVLHVNGDDVEAVVRVCKLASEWRQKFKRDIFIDIVCYRLRGHNEGDEPNFTQPIMYQAIKKQTPVIQKYSQQLIKEGVVTQEQYLQMKNIIHEAYEKGFQEGIKYQPKVTDWLESKWEGIKAPIQQGSIKKTGLSEPEIQLLGKAIYAEPENFEVHEKIRKLLLSKKKMFETGTGFDWATAEALAFSSLLTEGYHVRLSGQDVERGTFSHRHAVLHDQKTDAVYSPLKNLEKLTGKQQAEFTVCNSNLSEFGVLGFELGYSLESPKALVLWEAQFGDFSNGAQVIIDQFLSSGEQKWMRQSGLTMLLPHGYDGAGPEHSSCRLERYLQLCDSDPNKMPPKADAECKQIQHSNWQVIYCTTPANYFHALRRQIMRDFRKPLIVAVSKLLLKYSKAQSSIKDFMSQGFQRLIPEVEPEAINSPDKIQRLIFCSGQVYYGIQESREAQKIKDTAIVRVEQLHPFPFDLVQEQMKLYPNAKVIWCQEEPMNMGAWTFVYPYFNTVFKSLSRPFDLTYAGRPSSASPAVASETLHVLQKDNLIAEALGTKKK
ncbi:2-oxoglutarate dehydrogenase [Tieghemostelium lacteum]|uniref:2-oxoglutarate dehydrogenase, mitochondrial n=1 Tax=Tieghemostelium lacteum TaxID=361077 RepID=A0A151ZKD9_TIELA|nr:2-oxoglutarate dehydrogenase [Tieghemostelium lacteum]|eukprot:KYQ94461.1 2-oxoglutarate dehydrogenase [Tieghemostelium lacteum]